MLSDTSGIFTILPSQTSYVPPGPTSSPTGAAAQTYNGCGLPPLPDYTYTGYQPPCTTTISGVVKTLYPIVPESDSSIFYPNLFITHPASPTSPITASLVTTNTAFGAGFLAQDLQCPTPITPIATKITVSSVTTIFSLISCNTATATAASDSKYAGVCHSSGFATFSVSGTRSVCCPLGWATTPLKTELYCFTSVGNVERRQVSTKTLGTGISSTLVEIQGLVFTSAGVVTKEVMAGTAAGASANTGGTSTKTSGAEIWKMKSWGWRVVGVMTILYV
jgi:hypothetical protein